MHHLLTVGRRALATAFAAAANAAGRTTQPAAGAHKLSIVQTHRKEER
jgi:hypothetical protein